MEEQSNKKLAGPAGKSLERLRENRDIDNLTLQVVD